MIYNRPDIISALVRRINSFSEGYRQNIAIIGDPYIGKTTLIRNILSSDEIKKDAIIPIYLEIKIEPFEFCAKRFIKSAIFQLMQSDPLLAKPQDTVLLMDDLKRDYPKTAQSCARVLQDIEKGRFDEAYSFMLDIPAMIFEESKKRCVLILDEFHNLENFTLRHALGTLAKKIMLQKDTMFLFLSSRPTVSQRLLNEKLYMLFGNFEKIFLPQFDAGMSRSFLQESIRSASLPHAYLDFLASFTGNKPFYMSLVCNEIERLVFSQKVPSDRFDLIIEMALSESMFTKTGAINQHFFNFFHKISDGKLLSKSSAVLVALSEENKKQNDIVRSTKLQARDVSKILNRLTEMDMLVRNGSMYRFKDKLFSFWLRSVYLKRIMSFSIDESLEHGLFRKEIASHLSAFIREFEKGLSSRVADLFRLFKNDVIQLNGRKHKFASFNEVERFEKDLHSDTHFLASNGKTRWLCMLKKEVVTESDMSDIVKAAKKKRQNRVHRHILVCVAGINQNAYLIAKQAKFWVWNMDDLNVLMELYGKPHVS